MNKKSSQKVIFFSIGTFRYISLLLLLCSLSLIPLEAQQHRQDSWWITLEEGKRLYRKGSYGEAFRHFETARENRKNYYAKMERDLVAVLSIYAVRRLGDDLSLLERYIAKEYHLDAEDALNELYYRVPKEKLGNSSNKALAELKNLKNYPEAEYWIGEVYRMEGEFNIALVQYQKAYDQRALLENPEFSMEIQYKMADLRRLRRDYDEMVKILDDILKADASWSQESFNRSNLLKSLDKNGITHFLVLFRHNKPLFEKAYKTLGFYYYTNNNHSKAAEHLLFAFLIQNSVVIDALQQSKYDYAFSTLPDLLSDIAKRRDLNTYLDEVEYFKTMYYLANSLYGINNRTRSREIWTFLKDHGKGEWKGRAASQLNNPQLDRIPERETIGRQAIP